MTPERFARLKGVFQEALERPAEDRRAWVAAACTGDAELLREVEALLLAHDTAGDFLEQPAQMDAEERDTLAPGSRLGASYEIAGVLGRGGMGIVYLARDVRLGRHVALKSLPASVSASPEMRERLRREARAAATISHAAVATVYALEEIDGSLYIATEYVPGETLAHEIAKGPIAAPRARAIARAVAGALVAAHDAGVIHRDLKPDNVLVNGDDVKVVDFGIAHLEGPEATRLTRAGALLGTPAYMAPEQLLGGAVDARADLYAFGVMLSEMLTGRHPLYGRGTEPPSLAAIVTRCMQTEPGARYASARELQQALGDTGSTGEAAASAPAPAARWWWEFHQLAAMVLYGAIVYPAWLGREALGGRAGRALFLVTLATVIIGVTLRAHLWFTARSYAEHLAWARRRNGGWLLAADGVFALALVAGGLGIGDSPLGIVLVAVGIGAAAAALVVEPVTTRAAFRSESG